MKTPTRSRPGWTAFAIGVCVLALVGCSPWFWGGAATGAAGGSAAYEYQNKRALDQLERQLEKGKISREEYLRRKREIDERSLIY
jgi:hypothetical protein